MSSDRENSGRNKSENRNPDNRRTQNRKNIQSSAHKNARAQEEERFYRKNKAKKNGTDYSSRHLNKKSKAGSHGKRRRREEDNTRYYGGYHTNLSKIDMVYRARMALFLVLLFVFMIIFALVNSKSEKASTDSSGKTVKAGKSGESNGDGAEEVTTEAVVQRKVDIMNYTHELHGISKEDAKQIISEYSEEHGIDKSLYSEDLVKLLSKHLESKEFVLAYPFETHLANPDATYKSVVDSAPLGEGKLDDFTIEKIKKSDTKNKESEADGDNSDESADGDNADSSDEADAADSSGDNGSADDSSNDNDSLDDAAESEGTDKTDSEKNSGDKKDSAESDDFEDWVDSDDWGESEDDSEDESESQSEDSNDAEDKKESESGNESDDASDSEGTSDSETANNESNSEDEDDGRRVIKEIPCLYQWDTRWGYKEYGSGVMGLTGCGPTALSMVTMYLRQDITFTPDWMADFSTENGFSIEGNGTSWAIMSEGAIMLGLTVDDVPPVEDTMARELLNGRPIICVLGPGSFTDTGHYVVITGYEGEENDYGVYEGGKFTMNDSNCIEHSTRTWSFDDFASEINAMWSYGVQGDYVYWEE